MTERDYSHRSTVQKLGVKPGERIEIAGDVGPDLRAEVRRAIGRRLVRTGPLDGAIVGVRSVVEARAALTRYRPRLVDTGYVWLVTAKRGHRHSIDQMDLVTPAVQLDLIDNKTCSVDTARSAIRLVIPRALRGRTPPG